MLGGTRPIWLVAIVSMLLVNLWLWPSRHWNDESSDREAAAHWVREHVAADRTLLVQDAGVFAVETGNPLVDLVGLKTPASIEAHRRWTLPSCGADRALAVAEIARSSQAGVLIVTTDWDRAFTLTAGLRRQGIEVTEIRPAPAGQFGYAVYRLDYPASRPSASGPGYGSNPRNRGSISRTADGS